MKCINRPINRSTACKKSGQKFIQEIPRVRNVTVHFRKMDTSASVILVEWDVSKYLKMSPSIWDRFEVQVRVKNEWRQYLSRTLNSTFDNSYGSKNHFAVPYQISEFPKSDNLKFRVRRVWTRPCMKRKITTWAFSEVTNITKLQHDNLDIVAGIQQIGENSVMLEIRSKTDRLGNFEICWKPEVHGAVVSKEFTCVSFFIIFSCFF